MTNSDIFKAAHKYARKILTKVGDYVIAFKLALKLVYKKVRKAQAIATIDTPQILFGGLNHESAAPQPLMCLSITLGLP